MSSKRPITPTYVIFYLLFLPDTWQVLIGLAAASLLFPYILTPGMGFPAKVVLFIMLVTIGYAGSRPLGKGIARVVKKWVIGSN